jgi:hypothetical protein
VPATNFNGFNGPERWGALLAVRNGSSGRSLLLKSASAADSSSQCRNYTLMSRCKRNWTGRLVYSFVFLKMIVVFIKRTDKFGLNGQIQLQASLSLLPG